MATLITHAKVYLGEKVIDDGFIRFNRQIEAVGAMADLVYQADDQVVNGANKSVIPGFIDVHSHGGYGIDTMDADPQKISMMTHKMLSEGITSYVPTTITQSKAKLLAALTAVAKAAKTTPQIVGIHMEGPFIDKEYMGAQPPQYIEAASVETLAEYVKAAAGLVKIVSLAPEKPHADALIDFCLQNNIVASAGHTKATFAQVAKSKITHITHLFNAQGGLHHRNPGASLAGLMLPNVYCEIIADGHHVCPEMVKLAYKLNHADRMILVTDAMRAKGMPEGKSELGSQTVWVKDGQARLANGALAGSVLRFDEAFANIIKFTNCSVFDAVLMSSTNAATQLNLSHKGKLLPGYDADINVIDADYKLVATYTLGKKFTTK